MSEEAKGFWLVVGGVVSVFALFMVLFLWSVVVVERDILRSKIAVHAARCVDGDIWNERRIAECHAIAERTVMRAEELWSRRFEPAKPTTGE